MNKKIIITQAVLYVETIPNIEENEEIIFLNESLKISDGFLLKREDNKFYLVKKFNNEETNYVTYKEIEEGESAELKETKALKPRKTTEREIELINEFVNKEIAKKIKEDGENVEDFDTFDLKEESDVISFDVSDTHIVVYQFACFLDELEDGKKFVRNFEKRYSIKHGMVFEYEKDKQIDDYDEDISEIKDLL